LLGKIGIWRAINTNPFDQQWLPVKRIQIGNPNEMPFSFGSYIDKLGVRIGG
jgi:hypothetical protein